MNKDILWALLCNKQNKVQKQNLYILLNRYQIFKIFKTKKMKNLNLKEYGLVEMDNKLRTDVIGGNLIAGGIGVGLYVIGKYMCENWISGGCQLQQIGCEMMEINGIPCPDRGPNAFSN